MGFADLHLHSQYSHDGSCTIEAILMQAEHRHLDVIAITDHDSMDGVDEALSLMRKYHLQVIPGMEISTADGHVLAYEITKPVPPGLPLLESILQVHAMGGFCIIPHPMVIGHDGIRQQTLNAALKNPNVKRTILGIEMINGGLFRRNHLAVGLEKQHDLAPVGNSDGHNIDAVGRVITQFEGTTWLDLKNALLQKTTSAHWHFRTFDPIYFAKHLTYRILRKSGYGIETGGENNTLKLSKISITKK